MQLIMKVHGGPESTVGLHGEYLRALACRDEPFFNLQPPKNEFIVKDKNMEKS